MRVELGLYRHYKGGKYEVLGTGLNEADLVPVVIYRATTESEPDKYWVRPVQSFLEMVETEQDGVVPRFSKLQE